MRSPAHRIWVQLSPHYLCLRVSHVLPGGLASAASPKSYIWSRACSLLIGVEQGAIRN